MTILTYNYLSDDIFEENELIFEGFVSSYNINTFKGRIFDIQERRPIPFELSEGFRQKKFTDLITASLRINEANRADPRASVKMTGRRVNSRNGRLKRILASAVGL